jgi:hypothetical protein
MKAAGFLVLAALVLTSCDSNDESPLAPEAPAPEDTTANTSMLVVDGAAHVSVAIDQSVFEPGSHDPVDGSFRAILEDSTGIRVFLPVVRLNGQPLVEERDPFDNPSQYTLDLGDALPGLALEDTLVFAVVDGGVETPPFSVRMAPSRVELLADSAEVSQGQALRFRWRGQIERLVLTLTDRFGTRVRANLTFERYTGLREIELPARDLAQLAPGPLDVAVSITDNEARFAGPRLVSLVHLTTQRRTWTLVP